MDDDGRLGVGGRGGRRGRGRVAGVIVGGTYGGVGWGGSVVAGGVWVYFLAVFFLCAAQ